MNKTTLLLAGALSMSAFPLTAAEIDITVKNNTHAIYFTPLVIGAHAMSDSLFTVGENASAALTAMAEGGQIADLVTMLDAASANHVANPASGLLAPGTKTMTTLMTDAGNNYLSLTAMMLPTNDGFVGLDSWEIPTQAGTYTINVNAYDAGTEANNELIIGGAGGAAGVLGIPAAPGMDAGTGGTGVTEMETNTTVHIHRGTLGDDDVAGGKSDLVNTTHRWLNPVATITVVVK